MNNDTNAGYRDNAALTDESDDNSPVDLRRYVSVFVQRWKLFLLVLSTFTAVYLFVNRHQTYSPKYQATFDLGISDERPVDGYLSPLQKTSQFPSSSTSQRVISNLLSVNFAQKIVDTLSLFLSDRAVFSDFHVETRIKQEFDGPIGPCQVRFDNGVVTVSNPDGGKDLTSGAGEFIAMGPFDIKLTPISDAVGGKSYALTFYSPRRTAFALRNSLSLKILGADKIDRGIGTTGIPYSGENAVAGFINDKTMQSEMTTLGILRISVYWGNPRDALDISSCLSSLIVKEDLNEKSVQFVQSKDFIDAQLVFYQEKLTQLEDEITGYKKLKKIVNLTASTQARIMQISGIESRISQLEIEETVLKNLNRYLAAGSGATAQKADTSFHFAPTLVASPVFQDLYSQLLGCEAALKSQRREYSPSHPKVLETQARISGLQDQLKTEAAKRLIAIQTEVGSVRSENQSLQGKLQNVPADEIQLARLERDRKIAEQLYTFFREKLEDIRVREAGVTTDLKIINPSIVTAGPVNPPKKITHFLIALMVAALLGAAVIFVVEYFDTSVRYLDPLKNKFNLPVYATIPVFNGNGKAPGFFKNSGPAEIRKNPLADLASPEFEAFRKLAINLEIAHPSKEYKTIFITSACPEDGKTFVTLNLGSVLSVSGKKVLLVDTDFRKEKGSLSKIALPEKGPGIFELLEGKTRLNDAIVSVPEYKIDMIPIGNVPPNPFVFLESERMKVLLDSLKSEYDYVLVDGLPALLFADAAYLAATCDGVLISCRYGRTSNKEVEDARAVLSVPNIDLIGLVLNFVPRTSNSYYYHHYHKYYRKYHNKNA